MTSRHARSVLPCDIHRARILFFRYVIDVRPKKTKSCAASRCYMRLVVSCCSYYRAWMIILDDPFALLRSNTSAIPPFILQQKIDKGPFFVKIKTTNKSYNWTCKQFTCPQSHRVVGNDGERNYRLPSVYYFAFRVAVKLFFLWHDDGKV